MSSQTWPAHPTVFEINTWVWLSDLSNKYGWFIELDSVPAAEWDALADWGFDAVWLMGVWERSPAGIGIANRNEELLEEFRRALPDFHPVDNVGAPDCVRRYWADQLVGGPGGLATARKELADRGMRLILDFVPNHVAPDHAWVFEHPEYLIQASNDDLRSDPAAFLRLDGKTFACGRGPDLPVRRDLLQVNGWDPCLRHAARETLAGIAKQCDGVRCDKAALLLSATFERTWGSRGGQRPRTEYWADILPSIRQENPDFLFIAGTSGDEGPELLQLGFDHCDDERMYERLTDREGSPIQTHFLARSEDHARLVRFLENHDRPRAAATFSPAKERAAAVAMATLPGVRLFHEGQLEGRKVRLPGSLARRCVEAPDRQLQTFYQRLLKVVDDPLFHDGEWAFCTLAESPDSTLEDVVAWSWVNRDDRCLVVVNLGDRTVQARVQVPWPGVPGKTMHLEDALSEVAYDRDADEIRRLGIPVELGPWNYHLFQCHGHQQQVIPNAA